MTSKPINTDVTTGKPETILPPVTTFSHTTTLHESNLLIAALGVYLGHLGNTAAQHQQQIDNPGFMNPQVDHHTKCRDDALAVGRQVIELQAEIAGETNWPIADIATLVTPNVREVFFPSAPVPGVIDSPAELNRPSPAVQGATSSNAI